jgi:regulator of RNase E activity RraA
MSHTPPPGFRILTMPAPLPADMIAAYAEMVTPHIGDAMNRLTGTVGLTRYHREKKLVGRAITVKTRAGDNLMIHKALDMAEPGDVIVVEGSGDVTQAVAGELMLLHAKARGLAGFVIDGAIRDLAAFREHDFPCYARGHTLRGPSKVGPGEINIAVSVGSMAVRAGDLIVGDEDGVIAVPVDQLELVLQGARKQAEREDQRKQAIAAGRDARGWIDTYLKAQGVIA